ncbi:hypothetical protein BU16DRAFT_562905 [Lophium mytilinum]|uniref:G-patch domain-containing protein n=1 Tax=Lophium mytilinum TaxID=390894 RepID=A0A6A6QN76_9PEZI|nr:hypothetical protein BU16DRAFT_562905 [Lophium mytilinum]
MDASAVLTRHGWRGAGHSLDPHNRGLAKPLLVSSKRDLSGVGARSKAVRTSDQWWARALDEGLRELGTGKTTTLQTVREKGVNQGGLYGFFVRGQGLEGTLSNSEVSTPPTSASTSGNTSEDESGREGGPVEPVVVDKQSKKRKREEETKEEGTKRRKAEKRDTKNDAQLQTTLDQIAKINRKAAILIKQQSKRGAFKAVMPSPSSSEKKEDANFGMNADRVRMINGAVKPQVQVAPQEPSKPVKKLSAKKSNIVREKAMREAKRELTNRLVREAQERGELPGMEHLSPEKVLEKCKKESKATKKAQKEESSRKKEEAKAAKKAQKQEAKAEKSSKKVRKERNTTEEEKRVSSPTEKAKPLTDEQRKAYAARAKEKGTTLDAYHARRVEKKAERKKKYQISRKAEKTKKAA